MSPSAALRTYVVSLSDGMGWSLRALLPVPDTAIAMTGYFEKRSETDRRPLQILFVVNQPDVYRSPNSNTWM